MMDRYTLAVFEPDSVNTTCVVIYYCANRNSDNYYSSESYWVVPGTWGDE